MKANNSCTKGTTLIELMTVLAITGIIVGIAIPGFAELLIRTRLTGITNELVSSLNLARSEAVKRGRIVVVRKTGTHWEDGWHVFVDIDRSTDARKNVFNDGDDIELRVHGSLPQNYTLRGNTNIANFIAYKPDGGSNRYGSFAICQAEDIHRAKMVVINSTGRIKVSPDADHDGIPETSIGEEISSCTSGF